MTGAVVRVTLLGGFCVTVDGVEVREDGWRLRSAANLVKVLALAPRRRMHREQVIDALWPNLTVDAALPRLHKAAHHARRSLGDLAGAVVLRRDTVALLPDVEVVVDALDFRAEAEAAVRGGAVDRAENALALYRGPLLPDDVYEAWTQTVRDELAALRAEVLRVDATSRMEPPRTGDDTHGVRDAGAVEPLAGTSVTTRPASTVLVGRRDVGDSIDARLARAEAGWGRTLLVAGAPGMGKSSVLRMARALARRRGWRIGAGTASAVEGPWPCGAVLEALGDLCRRHPSAVAGMTEEHRRALDLALTSHDDAWAGAPASRRLLLAAEELLRSASTDHGVLLTVDELHEADTESLRLLHYLARRTADGRVVLVLAARHAPRGDVLDEMRSSLVARGLADVVELDPLGEAATRRLLRHEVGDDLDEETVRRVWELSAGVPSTALQLAREAAAGGPLEVQHAPSPHRRESARTGGPGRTVRAHGRTRAGRHPHGVMSTGVPRGAEAKASSMASGIRRQPLEIAPLWLR